MDISGGMPVKSVRDDLKTQPLREERSTNQTHIKQCKEALKKNAKEILNYGRDRRDGRDH